MAGVPVVAGAVVLMLAVGTAVLVAALQLRPTTETPESAVGLGPATFDFSAEERSDRGDDVVAGPGDAIGAEPGEPAAVLIVHVVGEVATPGLVEIPSGARVAEAIEAAGGATEAAELAGVNLARPAVDGEQIIVPGPAGATAAAGGSPTPDISASGGAAPGGQVNLNTADSAELATLPRVGPALAQRIIDWREANGGFRSVEQVLEVAGIGSKTFEGFRDRVVV